jgi:hypothetical protein
MGRRAVRVSGSTTDGRSLERWLAVGRMGTGRGILAFLLGGN